MNKPLDIPNKIPLKHDGQASLSIEIKRKTTKYSQLIISQFIDGNHAKISKFCHTFNNYDQEISKRIETLLNIENI